MSYYGVIWKGRRMHARACSGLMSNIAESVESCEEATSLSNV